MKFSRVSVALPALAALALVVLPPVGATTAGAAVVAPPAIKAISSTPASWTPSLLPPAGPTAQDASQIRQLVPCGNMMYAVGGFSQIKQGGTTYTRNNAFSFDASTGAVSDWDPNVNGKVNSIALSADCSTAYLGGVFGMVNVDRTTPQNATNLAAVQGAGTTGDFVSTFGHTANGQVSALLTSGTHVLVGGYFTKINGSSRGYLASLNPLTGADDGYVNLNISGYYNFTDASGAVASSNTTRVYNFALSPDGSKVLVMGDFTSVGGLGRRQMFMLNLGVASATVNPWYSAEFDKNCDAVAPYWLQDASWSPDGSKIYIATTGIWPSTETDHNGKRTELCDAAAAFPATGTNVSHLWVNYTGCDSLFSTAADATTVFVGGHHRWLDNGNVCSNHATDTDPGPGGVNAPGMGALSPSNGRLSFNPTRGRGIGADDMVITGAGLWIASDNLQNTQSCAGVNGHAGICFLPYATAKQQTDHTGDGVADKAVWRPSNGNWYVKGVTPYPHFGQSGDVPLSADFNGDGKLDVAVWRPSDGTWNISGQSAVPFGQAGDQPVPADYDGDGSAEIVLWRPSDGTWYVNGGSGTQWGQSGDIPVPADYTGDGKVDFAVWRPSNGTFYVNGQDGGVQWGKSGDKPVVADFTGDGRPDFAVWRPSNGTWYIRTLAASTAFGASTDIPVPGDYDGDGKADIAVWRPSNGTWYVRGISPNTQWGMRGDVPLLAVP
ncbi:MAG: VCBS repeat-containing protein [Mycobacteriales bacterium]